jgi:hypothetical protein
MARRFYLDSSMAGVVLPPPESHEEMEASRAFLDRPRRLVQNQSEG